jgi:hypothetical protein
MMFLLMMMVFIFGTMIPKYYLYVYVLQKDTDNHSGS